ncbi:MAG TPA: hypothetical protein VMT55_04425 [Candidatus Sulfotelmatobacter sp.]|nr:hypothetical protein [Candidatus Sulfotelmatobacter sp.]
MNTFGTRPMGMGGAFTAVADDANAAYWNPAGLALNPEVSLTASTKLNNRNSQVGDNIANLKMCYEMEMNPFVWIAGVGLASIAALEGARYLSDQGILQQNWGRAGKRPSRDEAVTSQVKGSEEVVSLKQELKDTAKLLLNKTAETAGETAEKIARHTSVEIGIFPYGSPWYRRNYDQPHYWEQPAKSDTTKAQFALGVSWLNDVNVPLDQKTNWYTLTVASGFEQRVAVGAGVNFYDLTRISDGIRGMGADLDLGMIARPVDYISVGLATKGALTTDFHWQTGEITRGYEMLVNGGLAIKPIKQLTLAADVHNILGQNGNPATMHYGAEVVVLPGLLARAGLNDGSKSVGCSVALGNLIVDYAILGGAYGRTQMVGGSWRF